MNCPNCGHETTADDRFCSNCGTRLDSVASHSEAPAQQTTPQPAQSPSPDAGETVIPSVGRRNAWEYERARVQSGDVDDEWKMSDLGPPPPKKRRTWLWIIIAILALLVLSCCIFLYWVSYTDSGVEWFSGIATEAAEIIEATEQASATPGATPGGTPQP